MTEIFVRYEYADGIARITLADGDRGNPVHHGSVAQLHDAVRAADRDHARVVVLAAEGRFFSVGGDLGAFADADDVAGFIDDLAEALHRVVSELVRSEAIVVSVVQGTAAGAGFPLAAAADVVIAAESAKFSLAYTKVGLSPDGGSSLLVHTLGLHRTLRLAILGDLLTAQEAYAAGLVARVVPADELTATADQVVAGLAAGSAAANAAAKRLLREAAAPAPETAMRKESLSIRTLAEGPDGREGVAAFVEKRAPRFNG
ncbi:enoyl-CoA hydratase/isomerase family protein [Nocardioides daeguensis]|uniref:Enoyl-CoA hydratase-related protein n=1 Tax=Nocardioides daeguensis TaxID=908359 RepID=A0ABP6UTM5_9ACTN|nr:enoyl-CoA hydratase-related protein [Nocardioides daeguensis]MBV6728655.1 enoyl-CoA hydratase/isomerase family protein [Nocardioides daeguensis]MCR1773736.1 enoyl-CoA hydratase/isomerase family protein [Nocardioides daeguensis]